MTTRDLQKTEELISTADFCARTASQIRMWPARKAIADTQAVSKSVRFLEDALSGGKFVAASYGDGIAGATASLDPLTWAADLKFKTTQPATNTRVTEAEYKELVEFLDKMRGTLCALQNDQEPNPSENDLVSAAEFFSNLGQIIGAKADSAIRRPESGSALIFEQSSTS